MPTKKQIQTVAERSAKIQDSLGDLSVNDAINSLMCAFYEMSVNVGLYNGQHPEQIREHLHQTVNYWFSNQDFKRKNRR